ncbi:hypothetical protein ILUMI_11149 [Ignelater luminosus]|uniref:Farnesol dehydrogenase-like n=1 Tax=Ignelater luminosus TaxID=2038154 RepID=A0A8K0D2M5_IGNLU|nr:hypothetical protein ILUMI_11149 [Ignelater luminosus]
MVLSLERWVGKVAVVTGASSGIGAAISEALVTAGLKVVGLARRKEKVEELAKKLSGKCGKLYAIETDVSKPQDIIKAFDWIKNKLGPIHVLINNAGVYKATNLTDGDIDQWKETFNINVLALCTTTREAIKDMKANNVNGQIIHINSVAGHKCPEIPNLNVYTASKYAVTALAETLRQELVSMDSKIKITSISPGTVKTGLVIAGGNSSDTDINRFFDAAPSLEPRDIADAVVYVLSTPPHVQIQELTVKPVGEKV